MQSSRLKRRFADEAALRHASLRRADHGSAVRRIRSAVERLASRDERAASTSLETVHRTFEERHGLRVEQYMFRHPMREGIRATLLAPAGNTQPGPAVLVSPGRRAILEQVTGVLPPDYPDRNVAERLSRSGLITLTLDYGLDGGLEPGRLQNRDEAALLADAFCLSSQPLLGALAEDALMALAWLREHPGVDPERIGLFGHSLGGAVALHTALLADTALPVCVASHLGTYSTMYGDLLSGSAGAILPGILRYADLPDLFATLVPAPLQLQYGTADETLSCEDASAAAEQIRKAYTLAGVEQHVEVHELAMGHGTDSALAIEFFLRTLNLENRSTEPRLLVPPLRVHFDATARREVTDRVDEALSSGVLTLGPCLADFEAGAEAWVGREAAAVSSGSAALEIAFRIVGVSGRTVLVPVNTFFATAAAAVRAGATVDFIDMELDGLGMDPESLERALRRHPDTAAVVVVHIGGIVSPATRAIVDMCQARGIPVIEDAAHAFGSRLYGAWAGTFGEFGAFSLYPTKVLTSGEGGILTARDDVALAAARRLRDHGKVAFEANLHDSAGSNWRMSEVHAAVGLAHLQRFAAMTRERQMLAAWYDEHLEHVPGLRRYTAPAGVETNGYKYLAFLPDGVDRRSLKARLRSRHQVALAGEVYDTLLNEQPFFASHEGCQDFPQARKFASQHVCLPLYPSMTRQQQERTVAALQAELS